MADPFDTNANELFIALTSDADFAVPDIDVSGPGYDIPGRDGSVALQPVTVLTNESLTNAIADVSGNITGSGTLDVIMKTLTLHFEREFKQGRIQGAEYTKAYIASVQYGTQAAVQYLLGRDAAYWNAQTAQMGLIRSRVDLAIAKTQLELARIQGYEAQAQYALTKSKLSTEEAQYEIANFNLEEILPQTKLHLVEQTRATESDADIGEYNLAQILPQNKLMLVEQIRGAAADADMSEDQRTLMLPKQILQVEAQTDHTEAQTDGVVLQNTTVIPKTVEQLTAQIALTEVQTDTASYNLSEMLPEQLAMLTEQVATQVIQKDTAQFNLDELLPEQKNMLMEQVEVQHAQTSDTRIDGITPVTGVLGKQKDLYDQQITSYQRDAEVKAGKLWIDAWITMKTIDEGLLPPDQFTNTEINEVLATLKTNNLLGSA